MGGSSNNSPFTVPKGFRFHPSDVELLTDYLEKKNQREDSDSINIIPEISVCNHEPRDLPALVFGRAEFLDKEWFTVGDTLDMEWYFFSPRDYKYPNSNRSNRTTEEGYWKITGKERVIKARGSNTVIGRRKILTFYERAEPKAKKTNWVIHEYHRSRAHSNDQIGDFVLCRLKKTSDKSDRDKEVSPICDEAETGSGGSSTVENQAAATGVITEAEVNLAVEELVNILNKHECDGSPTDSCLAEKNDPSYSVEGQPDCCISLEMIDELYDKSGNPDSNFNPPQPHQLPQIHQPCQTYKPQIYPPSTGQSPTSTQLGNVSHTNNANYGKCHKRKYTFGDNTSDPPKKKSITNNDHDEVLGIPESCYENQAANDWIPEGYPQPGTNLGSLPIQQQDSLPSINREPRDVSHDNDFIEWDDLLPPFGDVESSLAKFSYPIIGDSVLRSDGNTEVCHGSGYSALAIGAKLQCS